MPELERPRKAEKTICALGIAAVVAAYVIWAVSGAHANKAGYTVAAVSAGLFIVLGLRFVPQWMRFWSRDWRETPAGKEEKEPLWLIFAGAMAVFALVQLTQYCFQRLAGDQSDFFKGLGIWLHLDSGRYFAIAEDWYPAPGMPECENLVFFPAYPLAVRLLNYLTGSSMASGLLATALFYGGAACFVYKLLRLDFSRAASLRTIKYMAILPAAFFFSAPMSESLFLLLCAACAYFARSGKWAAGCIMGALAAFTRSVGILTMVFLIMEAVSACIHSGEGLKKWLPKFAAILIVPLGLLAYMLINYTVTGDPLAFFEYESKYWGQSLTLFFSTMAFQLDNGLAMLGTPDYYVALATWLPNVAYELAVLILLAFAVKKFRPSYGAWFIVYYVLTIGATYLISGPRYLVAALPVYPALAIATENRKFDLAFSLLCIVLSLFYLYLFVLHWGVY